MIAKESAAERRTVFCADGTGISYQLTRKRVKNINLRIHPDGTVSVSAPLRSSLKTIDGFVLSKSTFIQKSLARFSEKRKWEISEKRYVSGESFYLLGRQLRLRVSQSKRNHIEEDGVYLNLFCKAPDDYAQKKRLVEKFFKQKCAEVFTRLIEKNYPLFQKYGVPFPTLKIRAMTTRWGSCIPSKKQITLNSALIHFSTCCIEYVVIHEFCHFRYPNHSKDFYAFMSVLMPDWKERKRELDETVLI